MRYSVTMHIKDSINDHVFSKEEIATIFGGKCWNDWQEQMIRIICENKSSITVKNARGNEIFYCTFNDRCADNICYCYQDWRRFRRFMNYIDTQNAN